MRNEEKLKLITLKETVHGLTSILCIYQNDVIILENYTSEELSRNKSRLPKERGRRK